MHIRADEKSLKCIHIRATETEVSIYRRAAGGNVSEWIRGMANERAKKMARNVATMKSLTNAH